MVFKLTTLKAKPVQVKPGESLDEKTRAAKEEAAKKRRIKDAPPISREADLLGDVRSTWNAKQRKALADQGRADSYGYDPNPHGEPYQPNPDLGPLEMLGDMGSTAVSKGIGALEGTAGMLGDFSDMKWDLARYMNRKLAPVITGDLGSHYPTSQLIDKLQGADPKSRYLPTTEEIGENVTDPLLEAMGPAAQEIGRHQPQTPWSQTLGLGFDIFADPSEYVAPGIGAANRGFRTFRKAVP